MVPSLFKTVVRTLAMAPSLRQSAGLRIHGLTEASDQSISQIIKNKKHEEASDQRVSQNHGFEEASDQSVSPQG
jgi:hypothetical protein